MMAAAFGTIDCSTLKQLAHRIKQHNRDGLRIFTDAKCADGGQTHPQKFDELFALAKRNQRLL